MPCRQLIVSLGLGKGVRVAIFLLGKGRAAGELRIAAAVQILDALHILCNDRRAVAGALRNEAGVLMHVGATMAWADGRRASFECSFDRAPVQHLEVRRSLLRRSWLKLAHCQDASGWWRTCLCNAGYVILQFTFD